MKSIQIIIVSFFVLAAFSLKIKPLSTLNSTNFQQSTGHDIDTFLHKGSIDASPWFLLFKIPICQHCQQAEMLFNAFYIDYHKRKHFQPDAQHFFEKNMQMAIINCQQSSQICQKFQIQHYPTYYVVEGNGDVCAYEGSRMPQELISYMSDRTKGDSYTKCRFIGKITMWTKFKGYFDPLLQIIHYDMFVIAFVVGPFLFGFVFSRTKKGKQEKEQIQDKKEN